MTVYRLERIVREKIPVWQIVTSGDGVVAEVWSAVLADRIACMLNQLEQFEQQLPDYTPSNTPSVEGDRA